MNNTEAANRCYKYVRNQIKKRDLLHTIIETSKLIRKYETHPPGMLHYQPWYLMYLIKMTFLHAEKRTKYKPINADFFNKCVNTLSEVTSHSPFLKIEQHKDIHKFLRQMAFQQFFYQKNIDKNNIARLHLFFGRFEANSKIQKKFNEMYGITINDYIKLSIYTWTVLEKSTHKEITFNKLIFSQSLKTNQKTIDNYFKIISLDIESSIKYIKSKKLHSSQIQMEIFEETPFIRYPFLNLNNINYLAYSTKVFIEHMNRFLFNTVTKLFDSNAQQDFSTKFETYIAMGLQNTNLTFLTEKDLQYEGKKVDFIINHPNSTILIECKAIELKSQCKASPTNPNLISSLKTSILKAFVQAHETIKQIKSSNLNLKFQNTDNFHLLIVTYSPLYLGSNFWDEFVEEYLKEKLSKENYKDFTNTISPENIFILCINELDILFKSLEEEKLDLVEFLKMASQANNSIVSSKLQLIQHIENPPDKMLPYLDKEFNFLFDEVAKDIIN